ncbi:chloramphenicol-sensitive protein RarD [Glaciihabitans tibetensis]|uniref:Chloramphenicol-sensitive protein RarD n=1 Tax=Glaciihabitans tibetensis TaxID=1266600 RepID=A0A2T0VBZ5_9MICO|nr:EamA family transporter RarD [Glaciihabitans tibetensis]PRY67598.1 chloramphenicol-sensitive protein RarD [Glaciihabitans tibetensis]
MSTTPAQPAVDRLSKGFGFAVAAYGLWGVLPIFFLLLAPAGAVEIVAWRVLFSVVFCAILLSVTRGWARLRAILADRRTTLSLGLAGGLILVNWLVFIFAALSGHVVEAALGYFTNPIVTVLLGVFVLREKLRPLQWAAIAISAVAVVVLALNYGAFPWIALALACSFGMYGLVKKRVGGKVDAISGLTIETMWISPIAIGMLIVVGSTAGLTIGTVSALHTTAMVATGVITAVPLLLFAAAARRMPLVHLGLVQYLAPILQFLIGVFVLGEDMPPARWAGFAIVWLALIVLTVDMLVASRAGRQASLQSA